MADLKVILGGAFTPPKEPILQSPETQFYEAIQDAGLNPPDTIVADGNLHRFQSGDKKDKTGWYVLFSNNIPAGRFGDWRLGIEQSFRANIGRKLTPSEEISLSIRLTEAKAIRDAELEKKHTLASDTVYKIWDNCTAADNAHPYLIKKGIKPHQLKVTGDGRLVAPLYDQEGILSTLQYIDNGGGKLYHAGGATGSCFCVIGSLDDPGVIYIAEGFATSATIHEETGRPCVVAYSASNLVPVTRIFREKYGIAQDIVIVADNDSSEVGFRYAEQASAKYGARVILPPNIGDANDYKLAGNDLKELLKPSNENIINKLNAIFASDLSKEYNPPNELVEGLMSIGALTVVYGDSNSGKTFWALSIASAVSQGIPAYGRKTDKGLVIYLASEAPGSIKSRTQAIKQYYGCNLENLMIVPLPMNFYDGDADAHDVIELVREISAIRNLPVHLIIGDTLARMSSGANENSGEDMGPIMSRFDKVALATNSALMIIHHNGKDQAKGARGWSGIRAHIDTEIEIAEKDGIRMATVTKQRELPSKGHAIYFKLEVVEMGKTKFGEIASTCVAVPDIDNQELKPIKKDSKIDKARKILENAWEGEMVNDKPFISRLSLKKYLLSLDYSERTITNQLVPSNNNGIINNLLIGGIIDNVNNGWLIIDNIIISALLMRR